MDMEIRVATPAERLYSYSQSTQIENQTGCIGHLRGDMGSDGKHFYTSWEDHRSDLNTQAFKAEFDKVVNALRFDKKYEGLFKGRSSLAAYCHSHPTSGFDPDGQEFGFRVDTAQYSYLMRLNPNPGAYNIYIYCYLREYLDRHMRQAEKGIRFITTDYKERFRIADGDRVRIIQPDGQHTDMVCRYIDETHMEVGTGSWANLLHICQFSEQMESCLSRVIPLRSSLPDQCYCVLSGSGEIVIVKKGESGYYPTEKLSWDREEARAIVDECNKAGGVTKAQEAAMLAGSMFGWDTPAADPRNYNEQGLPIKPRHSDRGDSR